MPAWMECIDLFERIREEMLFEAVETLRGEMSAGRIGFAGRLVTLPDSSPDAERDIYVIRRLVAHEAEIRAMYEKEIIGKDPAKEVKDPSKVERLEGLRKFLLSLTQITVLMRYSAALGAASERSGKYAKEKDLSKVIRLALGDDKDTREALAFTLENKKMAKEGVISEVERKAIELGLS